MVGRVGCHAQHDLHGMRKGDEKRCQDSLRRVVYIGRGGHQSERPSLFDTSICRRTRDSNAGACLFPPPWLAGWVWSAWRLGWPPLLSAGCRHNVQMSVAHNESDARRLMHGGDRMSVEAIRQEAGKVIRFCARHWFDLGCRRECSDLKVRWQLSERFLKPTCNCKSFPSTRIAAVSNRSRAAASPFLLPAVSSIPNARKLPFHLIDCLPCWGSKVRGNKILQLEPRYTMLF